MPLYLFKIGTGNYKVYLGGAKGDVCVIPHGWGQKIDAIRKVYVKKGRLYLETAKEMYDYEIRAKERIQCEEKVLPENRQGCGQREDH